MMTMTMIMVMIKTMIMGAKAYILCRYLTKSGKCRELEIVELLDVNIIYIIYANFTLVIH